VTPERYRRAQEIFAEALEQPAGSRAAFVARACEGDQELAREAQSLLESFGALPDDFLAKPAVALVTGSALGESEPELGHPLEPGMRLGPYEIVDQVGSGGMGEVYRARDPRLDRDVAVKVLPGSFSSDPVRLRRFEQEARAAGSINHPNITTVYDVGAANGAPYVVFELLEGETLRDRLRGGPLPQRRAVDYGRQIARGLAAAHEKGIVHRDLKPENLFLTRDGRVRILDFGLAKQSPAKSGPSGTSARLHTDSGTVLGTVGYMSPEQVRGEPVDQRSDIFSLGSILYEMLTGLRAFHGSSSIETMSAILKEEPAELTARGESPPPPVERIVRHCLEKDRDERFQSARDLAFALETLSGSSPAVSAASGPWRDAPTKIWSTTSRRSVFAVGIAAAVAVTLGLLLRPRAIPDPPVVRLLTYSGHDRSPAASPDGRLLAFVSDRDGVARIWIKQLAGGGEAAISEGPDDYPRFSPDGATILFSRTEARSVSLFRVPVLGGEPRKLVSDAVDGDWSPDGRHIVFVRLTSQQGLTDTSLRIANENGGEERELARLTNQTLLHPRWSPDGTTIAAAESGFQQPGQPRRIFVTSVDGGSPRWIAPPSATNRLSSVAWSGNGELVYSQALSDAAVVSQAPARVIRQAVRSGQTRTLLWASSGSEILDLLGGGHLVFDASSTRENIREASPDGGTSRWLTRGNCSDRQPSYSPDSRWVVFSSNRSGRWNLWEVSRSMGTLRRLTDGDATDWDPGFTPDGSHLLWSSNRGGHYEIWMAAADGSAPRQVTHDGMDAENPTETPDGEWIVYSSSNPLKAGIWKIHPDGSGASQLVAGLFAHPEVSPDGRFAVFQTVYVPEGVSIRVARITDGSLVPFEVNLRGNQLIGRSRWFPGVRGIAFVGQGDGDVTGVYAQDFDSVHDTTSTRRRIAGFDSEFPTESFGLSADGSRVTVAVWEQQLGIMSAEGVPGVSRTSGPQR
jgi:eukaryotic-like serine/threonine-protein kinase